MELASDVITAAPPGEDAGHVLVGVLSLLAHWFPVVIFHNRIDATLKLS